MRDGQVKLGVQSVKVPAREEQQTTHRSSKHSRQREDVSQPTMRPCARASHAQIIWLSVFVSDLYSGKLRLKKQVSAVGRSCTPPASKIFT